MSDAGHPVVAAILDFAMWSLRRVRRRLLPRAQGRVLEIGAGTGLNFQYYSRLEELVAIEPDPHMLRRARRRLEGLAFPARLEQESAEALPFGDAEFDTVVVTWALCTIPSPERALAEMRRVLKPGGLLVWVEHVRATGRVARWLQERLNLLWRRCAAGCNLTRDAAGLIQAAGFRNATAEPVGRQHWTLTPHMSGTAQR